MGVLYIYISVVSNSFLSVMEVIERGRGVLYCMDGFMYAISKCDNVRCVQHTEKCPGTAKLYESRTRLEVKKPHNHEPDFEEVERLKLKQSLKR